MNEILAGTPPESRSLLVDILRLSHVVEQQLDAALQPEGLSLPKLTLLHHLVQAGDPVPLGVLSGRLGCVKSNVTQLIDRLEADRLVQRVPDPDDRRSKLAAITGVGRLRYEAGQRAVAGAEQTILASFSAADRDLLAHLLRRFREG